MPQTLEIKQKAKVWREYRAAYRTLKALSDESSRVIQEELSFAVGFLEGKMIAAREEYDEAMEDDWLIAETADVLTR